MTESPAFRLVTDADRYWSAPATFGWFGTFAGAFRDADLFHKFDVSDLDALAHIAAEAVLTTQQRECGTVYNLRPGVILRCTELRGHHGRHNDQEWTNE